MSVRTTAVLVALAVLLGASWLVFGRTKAPEQPKLGPTVWAVEEEAIERIEVVRGQRVAFAKGTDGRWTFDEPGRPEVDPKRWGGIPLLVSGPASKRVIVERPESLAQFGLDRPRMEIALSLRGGAGVHILVGDRTPDETACYVKLRGAEPVYTVDSSWEDVLARLAREPPRVGATPASPGAPPR